MRVPVGREGWYLCDWSDQPDFEYTQFRGGRTLSLQWVEQFRDDAFALSTLRNLLGKPFPPLGEEQVVQEVAWRLISGEWLARRRVIKWEATRGTKRQEGVAAFPKEERRSAAPPSQSAGSNSDSPVFPGDIDPVAIAEAQKRAAAEGVPFCEECLRAQMAGNR